MKNGHRAKLTEKDFAALVSGKIVTLTGWSGNIIAEVALDDIGWDRMFAQIELARRAAGDGDI